MKNRTNRFSVARFGAVYLISGDLLNLLGTAFIGSLTNADLSFYVSRFSAFSLLFLAYISRDSDDYYIPVLREITDDEFWNIGIIILFSVRLLLTTPAEIFPSWLRYIEAFVCAYGIVSVFSSFTQRTWTNKVDQSREKRIEYLSRKAKITPEELEVVKSDLISAYNNQQKPPKSWSWTLAFLSFAVGLLINEYIADIYNLLNALGVRLPNILPPF